MHHDGRARAAMRLVDRRWDSRCRRRGNNGNSGSSGSRRPHRTLPASAGHPASSLARAFPTSGRWGSFSGKHSARRCSASRFRFLILPYRRASGSARRASCPSPPSARASPPGSAVRLFPPRPRPRPDLGQRGRQQEQPINRARRKNPRQNAGIMSEPPRVRRWELKEGEARAARPANLCDLCGGNRGISPPAQRAVNILWLISHAGGRSKASQVQIWIWRKSAYTFLHPALDPIRLPRARRCSTRSVVWRIPCSIRLSVRIWR